MTNRTLELRYRQISLMQDPTLDCFAQLTPAHEAGPGDLVAAVRAFEVQDRAEEYAHDEGGPVYCVASEGPIRNLNFLALSAHDRPAGAMAYTALCSDPAITNAAEKYADRKYRTARVNDSFDVFGLFGCIVIRSGHSQFWMTSLDIEQHVPALLSDVQVLVPDALSNHTRLCALEGARAFLFNVLNAELLPVRERGGEVDTTPWPVALLPPEQGVAKTIR